TGFGVAVFLSFFIGSYAVEFITKPVKDQLRAYHERRTEKTMQELQNNLDLQALDKPTGWTKTYFHLGQLKAVLNGKANEENEAFPRPICSREGGKSASPSWSDRIIGGSNGKEDRPGERGVTEQDGVGIWPPPGDPQKKAAFEQAATRRINDLD